MTIPASLFLADGSRFDGTGLATKDLALGEAVFYTGMTGYEEALTDPSYAGQILTFTYPLIGNYGVSGSAAQYPRACVCGAIVKEIAHHPSHYLSKTALPEWLDEQRFRRWSAQTRVRSRSRCANTARSGPRWRSARRRSSVRKRARPFRT